MARITLRQLLDHAAEHAYGVPAFNINNMEQGLAIMEANDEESVPDADVPDGHEYMAEDRYYSSWE